MVNAVYWFRKFGAIWTCLFLSLTLCSILLYLQVCTCLVDGSSPDWVSSNWEKFTANDQIANRKNSGAQIVFRSFIQPVFSRYFSQSGSTAANLRSQADQATKPHAM